MFLFVVLVLVLVLFLKLYVYLILGRYKFHVREIPENINMKSSIIYFLYLEDITSIPLIPYLVSQQNYFLEKCSTMMQGQPKCNRVNVSAVKTEDVIKYGRKDLYSSLYSYCDHSYEIGGRSRIKYDMHAVERDLVNSIFFNSSYIDFNDNDLKFSFVDHVYYPQLFRVLQQKISQVSFLF